MTPEEVEATFDRLGVRRTGHFALSSGAHSDTYLQCALALADPQVALALGRALAAEVRSAGLEPDVVLSPALGGVLAGFVVAAALPRPFLFAERDGTGAFVLRRGQALEPGARVLVVEDVVTTGGSAREAGELAVAAGAVLIGLASLVDRSAGVPPDRRPDPPPVSLYRAAPSVWDPSACPLCAAGRPLDRPGSRPVRPSPDAPVEASGGDRAATSAALLRESGESGPRER